MRIAIISAFLILAGCVTPKRSATYWTSSVSRYADTNFARRLAGLLERIERGDLSAWSEFASYNDRVDGEYGETYATACAELARRDPTFYLRRYLLGDARALPIGRKAYGWSGDGRSLLDRIYAGRLYIADDPKERHQIETFISKTAQWKTQ